MSFLDAHIVAELRQLAGRAKVTFPYKEGGDPKKDRLARVERVQKVSRGTADNIKWLLDYETADEEWPNAKLVEQIKLGEDDQHAEVYRRWEELTGLPLRTVEQYRGGIYRETVKQRVPAGTLPVGAVGFVLSDTVTNSDEILADRITVRLVDENGNPTSGDTVLTSERTDEETGIVICTDHFLAASTYVLPPIYVGGTPAQIRLYYASWKWPLRKGSIATYTISNGGSGYATVPTVTIAGAAAVAILTNGVVTSLQFSSIGSGLTVAPSITFSSGSAAATCTVATNSVGYTTLSYSAPRYVFAARKQSVGDESDKFLVEIEYGRIPDAHVKDAPIGMQFPTQLWVNPDGVLIPSNYAGSYPPPWPIGEDKPDGYRLNPARSARTNSRTYITHTLGRTEALPKTYSVVSPGKASKIYGRLIDSRTIHGPIIFYEEVGGVNVLVEDIPSSTPPDYDLYSILIVSAVEEVWRGEIWRQSVTVVSELTPLSAFPDPVINGYYRAGLVFGATPDIMLDAPLKGAKLYAITTGAGGESVALTVFGKAHPTDTNGSQSESITAAPTVSGSSVTTLNYSRVLEVLLAAPLSTDAVVLYESIDPDNASLLFTALPADGDKLVIGLAATATANKTYTYRTVLAIDGILFATVAAAGAGYTSLPAVGFTGGGTGAAATATLKAVSKTIGAGGAGYTAGDVLTLSGGTFTTAATFTVLVVSGGGAVTTASIANGGIYTVPQTGAGSATTGGTGTGCTLTVGYGVGAITMTSSGTSYTAPGVTFTGGGGSGATATATVDLRVIKIGSTLADMASNTVRAIMGTGLDIYASADGSNPDATASIDAANAKLVHFYGTNPTAVGGTYTGSGIFENDGATPENFGTFTAFVSGSVGEILATIPAGTPYAYFQADFGSNRCLMDESTDNDRKAVPTLPAARVFYTDWKQIPQGKAIRLEYAAHGSPALRFAWQKSATAAEPNTVTTSFGTCTLNSATFTTAVSSAYIGCKVLLGDDRSENEILTVTTLLRTYQGTTGTKTGIITPLVATLLPTAATGKRRFVGIGTPGAEYIRLKITRMGNPPFGYRPIYAEATWLITPNG